MEKKNVFDMYAQKVADICRVPVDTVIKLREMDMLNMINVRNALIYNDYWVLRTTGKFTVSQVYEKLSVIYNVGRITIYNVVKERHNKSFYCRSCGAKMMKNKFIKNGGICDRCIATGALTQL